MKTASQTSHHILVVDDEPTVCRAIKLLLKFDGHEVQTVASGEAALALLEQAVFDLIITDYSMGGMKGDQLAAIIKQRWPGQPVIMATAFTADVEPSGKSSGVVDRLLIKPFALAELREAIAAVMSRKTAPPAPPAAPASRAGGSKIPPPVAPPPASSGASSFGRARL